MRRILFLAFWSVAFLIIFTTASASKALPEYGVNEATKECSEFFMGDECVTCSLPDGWSRIEEMNCPNGYTEIEEDSVCIPSKNEFCCTVSHSGMSGDCDDVVVNHEVQKCAFVDNIGNCEELPENWQRADKNEIWGRVCPNWDYEWIEGTLMCKTEAADDDGIDQQIYQEQELEQIQQKNNERVVALLAFAMVLILSVAFIFILN